MSLPEMYAWLGETGRQFEMDVPWPEFEGHRPREQARQLALARITNQLNAMSYRVGLAQHRAASNAAEAVVTQVVTNVRWRGDWRKR